RINALEPAELVVQEETPDDIALGASPEAGDGVCHRHGHPVTIDDGEVGRVSRVDGTGRGVLGVPFLELAADLEVPFAVKDLGEIHIDKALITEILRDGVAGV